MVSKSKVYIGVISSFFVGCILGLAIGGYQGFGAGTLLVINGALSKDAREVEIRIEVLNHLQASEQEQAIALIETGLADILIGFDPVEPYTGLNEQTVVALRSAINEAKKYRLNHPRQKRDFRDEMVENLFARELYR